MDKNFHFLGGVEKSAPSVRLIFGRPIDASSSFFLLQLQVSTPSFIASHHFRPSAILHKPPQSRTNCSSVARKPGLHGRSTRLPPPWQCTLYVEWEGLVVHTLYGIGCLTVHAVLYVWCGMACSIHRAGYGVLGGAHCVEWGAWHCTSSGEWDAWRYISRAECGMLPVVVWTEACANGWLYFGCGI